MRRNHRQFEQSGHLHASGEITKDKNIWIINKNTEGESLQCDTTGSSTVQKHLVTPQAKPFEMRTFMSRTRISRACMDIALQRKWYTHRRRTVCCISESDPWRWTARRESMRSRASEFSAVTCSSHPHSHSTAQIWRALACCSAAHWKSVCYGLSAQRCSSLYSERR